MDTTLDIVCVQSQGTVEEHERELKASKATSHFDDVNHKCKKVDGKKTESANSSSRVDQKGTAQVEEKEEGRRKAKVQHKYQPGDKVNYWSQSHSRWCSAKVIKKNNDGTWDLNVKPGAKAKFIRLCQEKKQEEVEEEQVSKAEVKKDLMQKAVEKEGTDKKKGDDGEKDKDNNKRKMQEGEPAEEQGSVAAVNTDVMESPCAKKARFGIHPLWNKLSHAELNAQLFSPVAERISGSPFQGQSSLQIENEKLIAAVASPMRPRRSLGVDGFTSPFQRPQQPQKPPNIDRSSLRMEDEKLIAAVASPMRPRRSLGVDGFENDKVQTLGQDSFEAKLALAATALAVEGPSPKKLRTRSGRGATPQVTKMTEPTHAGNPSLEGFWKSEYGSVCAKISGSDIKFSTCESIFLLERVAKKKVSLCLDDETHTGFVNDKDNVILWSDGDMWFFVGTSIPPGKLANSKQDGGVNADAVNEWVQMQWMSLTESTQESIPKVDENKKDARQKVAVVKKPLPLGPHHTTTETQQSQKRRPSTPASAVAWTPDRRVRLREKIQALLVETPTEVREVSPSSRSSSRRSSRVSSPRTPERARLFHGSSSPQKRRDSTAPQPPPGSPGCDGVFVPPPPPESPPPPPPESPPSDAVQTQQPCSTTLVRRSRVWPAMHLKIRPNGIEEFIFF